MTTHEFLVNGITVFKISPQGCQQIDHQFPPNFVLTRQGSAESGTCQQAPHLKLTILNPKSLNFHGEKPINFTDLNSHTKLTETKEFYSLKNSNSNININININTSNNKPYQCPLTRLV